MPDIRRISQRDLRMRSKEIMDSVEGGQTFAVTRGGRDVAELVPIERRRRFVTRAAFAAGSRLSPTLDADRFRHDLDEAMEGTPRDPFAQ